MSPLKHTLLTIAIVASGFTIAYFVDDLQMGTPRVPCPCEYPELILLPDVQCYPLLAPQGRPRSLSSCPVFSTGRSVHTGWYCHMIYSPDLCSPTQLSHNDPNASKTLSRAALGLAIYGMFIFVFW